MTKTKNKVGRPPKYKTPEELQNAVDNYFNTTQIPTVNGLALALGFNNFRSLIDYAGEHKGKDFDFQGNSKEFSNIITRAKARILDFLEKTGISKEKGSVAAIVHCLKVMKFDAPQQISGQDGEPIEVKLVIKNGIHSRTH